MAVLRELIAIVRHTPKGFHNQIRGNCAAQLVGFLNTQVQISAVWEMAGASRDDELKNRGPKNTGEFYLKTAGWSQRRVRATMCRSYHP